MSRGTYKYGAPNRFLRNKNKFGKQSLRNLNNYEYYVYQADNLGSKSDFFTRVRTSNDPEFTINLSKMRVAFPPGRVDAIRLESSEAPSYATDDSVTVYANAETLNFVSSIDLLKRGVNNSSDPLVFLSERELERVEASTPDFTNVGIQDIGTLTDPSFLSPIKTINNTTLSYNSADNNIYEIIDESSEVESGNIETRVIYDNIIDFVDLKTNNFKQIIIFSKNKVEIYDSNYVNLLSQTTTTFDIEFAFVLQNNAIVLGNADNLYFYTPNLLFISQLVKPAELNDFTKVGGSSSLSSDLIIQTDSTLTVNNTNLYTFYDKSDYIILDNGNFLLWTTQDFYVIQEIDPKTGALVNNYNANEVEVIEQVIKAGDYFWVLGFDESPFTKKVIIYDTNFSIVTTINVGLAPTEINYLVPYLNNDNTWRVLTFGGTNDNQIVKNFKSNGDFLANVNADLNGLDVEPINFGAKFITISTGNTPIIFYTNTNSYGLMKVFGIDYLQFETLDYVNPFNNDVGSMNIRLNASKDKVLWFKGDRVFLADYVNNTLELKQEIIDEKNDFNFTTDTNNIFATLNNLIYTYDENLKLQNSFPTPTFNGEVTKGFNTLTTLEELALIGSIGFSSTDPLYSKIDKNFNSLYIIDFVNSEITPYNTTIFGEYNNTALFNADLVFFGVNKIMAVRENTEVFGQYYDNLNVLSAVEFDNNLYTIVNSVDEQGSPKSFINKINSNFTLGQAPEEIPDIDPGLLAENNILTVNNNNNVSIFYNQNSINNTNWFIVRSEDLSYDDRSNPVQPIDFGRVKNQKIFLLKNSKQIPQLNGVANHFVNTSDRIDIPKLKNNSGTFITFDFTLDLTTQPVDAVGVRVRFSTPGVVNNFEVLDGSENLITYTLDRNYAPNYEWYNHVASPIVNGSVVSWFFNQVKEQIYLDLCFDSYSNAYTGDIVNGDGVVNGIPGVQYVALESANPIFDFSDELKNNAFGSTAGSINLNDPDNSYGLSLSDLTFVEQQLTEIPRTRRWEFTRASKQSDYYIQGLANTKQLFLSKSIKNTNVSEEERISVLEQGLRGVTQWNSTLFGQKFITNNGGLLNTVIKDTNVRKWNKENQGDVSYLVMYPMDIDSLKDSLNTIGSSAVGEAQYKNIRLDNSWFVPPIITVPRPESVLAVLPQQVGTDEAFAESNNFPLDTSFQVLFPSATQVNRLRLQLGQSRFITYEFFNAEGNLCVDKKGREVPPITIEAPSFKRAPNASVSDKILGVGEA